MLALLSNKKYVEISLYPWLHSVKIVENIMFVHFSKISVKPFELTYHCDKVDFTEILSKNSKSKIRQKSHCSANCLIRFFVKLIKLRFQMIQKKYLDLTKFLQTSPLFSLCVRNLVHWKLIDSLKRYPQALCCTYFLKRLSVLPSKSVWQNEVK